MSKSIKTSTTTTTTTAQTKNTKLSNQSLKKPTDKPSPQISGTRTTLPKSKPSLTAQSKTKNEPAKTTPTPSRSIKTTGITTSRNASTTKVSTATATKSNAVTNLRTRTTTQSSYDKNQALRANHGQQRQKTSDSSKHVTNAVAKANAVLDTYHNVTVSSPPSKRKEFTEIMLPNEEPTTARERTRTRTLHPDEVVVLKRESAKQRLEAQIQAEQLMPKKQPIAFEVKFDEQPNERQRERSRSRARREQERQKNTEALALKAGDEEAEANYSDDFDSYESDFESEKGSTTTSVQATSTDSDETSETDEMQENGSGEDENSDKADTYHSDDEAKLKDEQSDEESELTQYPITVIQRDKEYERKLDSGNYDMNSRRNVKLADIQAQSTQQQFDSLEMLSTATTTSEQLDSGISNFDSNSHTDFSKSAYAAYYGGYDQFNTNPVHTKRGKDILSKIKFDTLSFVLFELKPISYEVFMQIYGKLNTTQTSTQTQEQHMHVDCQTEDIEVRTMWTQHPGQYDRASVQQLDYTLQNSCGEVVAQKNGNNTTDQYDASLEQLRVFQQADNRRCLQRNLKQLNKAIDLERLNAFLQRAANLMSNVLNGRQAKVQHNAQLQLNANKQTNLTKTQCQIAASFLNALHVVRVFANARFNLIITVHECAADANVYRADFSQLLMIWSTSECSKPIRLLSTWSEVCHAEICNMSQDILVCGLRDGSVAMWDLRETYSYCSKLDGYLTHFAATQTIVPHMNADAGNAKVGSKSNLKEQAAALLDIGAVVDIRSFRVNTKGSGYAGAVGCYEPIQFVSLNDNGIITLWTLVERTTTQYSSTPGQQKMNASTNNNKFEYSSPWARILLIQTAITDVRAYLQESLAKAQSQFDKTKKLFQNNVYSDELLREFATTPAIQEHTQQPLQGLRFTSIDCGYDRVYVCTNRNFILSCSRTLKTERFRRITINDSKLLFPTALCVLSNEDFIAVGLSNGSVILLNCQQRKRCAQPQLKPTLLEDKANAMPTPSIGATTDDLETGKSCAIQNIILNERRSFDEPARNQPEFDVRPSTAACIDMITNRKRPFELSVYDQQLLLSGSTLRQDLVRCLELSCDGWRLFALTNGKLRVYDFYMETEIDWPPESKHIKCIAVARTTADEQHLIVLQQSNEVYVHTLTQ